MLFINLHKISKDSLIKKSGKVYAVTTDLLNIATTFTELFHIEKQGKLKLKTNGFDAYVYKRIKDELYKQKTGGMPGEAVSQEERAEMRETTEIMRPLIQQLTQIGEEFRANGQLTHDHWTRMDAHYERLRERSVPSEELMASVHQQLLESFVIGMDVLRDRVKERDISVQEFMQQTAAITGIYNDMRAGQIESAQTNVSSGFGMKILGPIIVVAGIIFGKNRYDAAQRPVDQHADLPPRAPRGPDLTWVDETADVNNRYGRNPGSPPIVFEDETENVRRQYGRGKYTNRKANKKRKKTIRRI